MFAIRPTLDRARAYQSIARGLDSGLPLPTALRLLAPNPKRFDAVIAAAADQIDRGASLSSALEDLSQRQTLPGEEIELIAAGERAGVLPELLIRLAARLEERAAQSRKLLIGLLYPTILLHLAILAGAAPLVVAGVGTFVRAVLPRFFLLWGLAAVVLLVSRVAGRGEGRQRLVGLAAQLPGIGKAVRSRAAAEYAHGVGLALSAGLPVGDSLRIGAGSTGWVAFENAVERLTSTILSGSSMAEAHARETVMPSALVEAVRVGEETGKLQETFQGVARLLSEEASRRVDFLAKAVPFVLYLLVALYVAFVVINGFVGVYSDLDI